MKATFTIEVEFDGNATDADAVGCAVDTLLETAMSTPGILDEYGDPGEFSIGPTEILESPADASHQPRVGVAQDATYFFDKITGASYHGFGFKQILMNDEEARKAARTLVERLKHHGAKGME